MRPRDPARVRRTRGRRRREVLRATAPGAFPPLPFAPGTSGPGPAGGGVRPELARRGRHCLPALRDSRRARVGRHPRVPVVGLRRRRGPTPAALAPQAGACASPGARLLGGRDPCPGWKELRGIIPVGMREACSPSGLFTSTPPRDLGGLASCPAPRLELWSQWTAGFPPCLRTWASSES